MRFMYIQKKITSLSVLLITLSFFYSSLIVALHHHDDLKQYADCAFCKFAQDLSGGDKETPHVLIAPGLLDIHSEAAGFLYIVKILAVAVPDRSPPSSALF